MVRVPGDLGEGRGITGTRLSQLLHDDEATRTIVDLTRLSP
jgi:hypothetical protein